MMDNTSLQQLLDQHRSGTLTAAGLAELRSLLQDPANAALVDALMDEQLVNSTVTAGDYPAVVARVTERLLADIRQPAERPVRMPLRQTWWAAAAVLLLLAGVGVYLFVHQPPRHEIAIHDALRTADILPGGNKAILTLSDGSRILLDSAANGNLASQANALIVKMADGHIEYTLSGASSGGSSTNTMTTPRGGRYQLVLSDGSIVWLNAASSITYPAVFTGKSRTVTVTGEAYFEIAGNKLLPFIVNTAKQSVEVLGTRFNINSYGDEAFEKTTLVDGAVRINGTVLRPGQAYANGNVTTANIEQDLAWKNGLFNFNGADIYTVMRQISRWYDIEVKYSGTMPRLMLKGKMDSELNLSEIMEVLHQMGVNSRINGKTVVITN